jgi:hypothetical protein
VFPSIRSKHKPLWENAMNSALRRMGYTKEESVLPRFRASAQTIPLERGFDEDVIDVALAHEEEVKPSAHTSGRSTLVQRVELMQAWADLLDEFRTQSTQKLLVS